MLVSGALLWHTVLAGDVCIRAERTTYVETLGSNRVVEKKKARKLWKVSALVHQCMFFFFFFLFWTGALTVTSETCTNTLFLLVGGRRCRHLILNEVSC